MRSNILECNLYLVVIYFIVNNLNKKIIGKNDQQWVLNNIKHPFVEKEMMGKEIASVCSGQRTNINVSLDYNNNITVIPDPVFNLLKRANIVLCPENKSYYFHFNDKNDEINFMKWRKIVTINKSLYVGKKSFIELKIAELIDLDLLCELPKKKNSVNYDLDGSVGVASKIYYYENDNMSRKIISNKFYIFFEDIFDENFNFKEKLYENIYNKLIKNEIIKIILKNNEINLFNELEKFIKKKLKKINID